MSEPLEIVVSALAAGQIRAAAEWWRVNRPKAPNAIREDLDRASSLIAIQPKLGARAAFGFFCRDVTQNVTRGDRRRGPFFGLFR